MPQNTWVVELQYKKEGQNKLTVISDSQIGQKRHNS